MLPSVGFYGLSLVPSPLSFSGQIPSIIDAFFEISSGFTTTGATILNDVSVLTVPSSSGEVSPLDWRDGGTGLALAIMDNAKNSHLEVMRAEVPGPVFGKVVSKLKTLPDSLSALSGSLLPFCGYLLPSRVCLSMIVLSSLWEQQELGALPSITMDCPLW